MIMTEAKATHSPYQCLEIQLGGQFRRARFGKTLVPVPPAD